MGFSRILVFLGFLLDFFARVRDFFSDLPLNVGAFLLVCLLCFYECVVSFYLYVLSLCVKMFNLTGEGGAEVNKLYFSVYKTLDVSEKL